MITAMSLKLRSYNFVSTRNMCIKEHQEARPEIYDIELNIMFLKAMQKSIKAASDTSKLLPLIGED
jgi:hypothetical protein